MPIVNLTPDLKLLDPATGVFSVLDGGNIAINLLLVNILLEMRVQNQYLSQMNMGVVADEPDQLRRDQTFDPASLAIFSATVSN
jgi:hypothetical protein